MQFMNSNSLAFLFFGFSLAIVMGDLVQPSHLLWVVLLAISIVLLVGCLYAERRRGCREAREKSWASYVIRHQHERYVQLSDSQQILKIDC